MPTTPTTPKGLATVALLKTRLDEGHDHLGLFEPFVADAILKNAAPDFVAADIKATISERTGLIMPSDAVQTLLGRFAKRGFLTRQGGRFFRSAKPIADPRLEDVREAIEKQQLELGIAFSKFAASLELSIESPESALSMLAGFVSENKVHLLLNEELPEKSGLDRKTSRVVARFITEMCLESTDLRRSLQALTEGILLQDTLFLRDIPDAGQRFQNLTVAVDTSIVLAVVGLTGLANELSTREGIALLRAAGAEVIVFETTLSETQRILLLYENKLATNAGRMSLVPTPLTQHVIKQRMTPADIRMASATIEILLKTIGVPVKRLPDHVAAYTLDEKELAARLADPVKPDIESPRVRNDVDCLAAVLTLRRGRVASAVERCVAVFSSTSGRVIKTIQKWFVDQGEHGVPPIVHHAALTSIAWLKKPAAAPNLKMYELAALCAAVMRPTRQTLAKFVETLRAMKRDGVITDDEAVAVLVSELTEPILARLDDDFEADSASIADAIERVRESYRKDAASVAAEVVSRATAETAFAKTAASVAIAKHDALMSAVEKDLLRRAARLSTAVFSVLGVVLIGAGVLAVPGVYETVAAANWIARIVIAIAALVGVVTAIRGGSLREFRDQLTARLADRLRASLPGQALSTNRLASGPSTQENALTDGPPPEAPQQRTSAVTSSKQHDSAADPKVSVDQTQR